MFVVVFLCGSVFIVILGSVSVWLKLVRFDCVLIVFIIVWWVFVGVGILEVWGVVVSVYRMVESGKNSGWSELMCLYGRCLGFILIIVLICLWIF